MTAHLIESSPATKSVTDLEFEAQLRNAKMQPDVLPLHEGRSGPRSSGAIDSLFAKHATSTTPAKAGSPKDDPKEIVTEAVCEECRKIFAMKDMTRFKEVWICAACKPEYFHKMGMGASHYASFMIRVFAKLLDGVIIFLCFLMPFVLHAIWAARDGDTSRFETLPQFLFFGYHMAYVFYSIFFIGRFGATPGKMLCKIKVVTADGGRVGYGRAIGRYFA